MHTTQDNIAYIGVGSNLADPVHQVRSAFLDLDAVPHCRVSKVSPLYRTPPMGPADQPPYVNAAVKLHTRLAPLPLLDALLAVERRHGRVRDGRRWGPRTLDLDLLLYGERIIDEPRLTVPHPGIAERAFVLLPLYDIAPTLTIPGSVPLAELCDRCDTSGIHRIED